MTKIDIHTHILPERWPDLAEKHGYPGFIRLEHFAPCRARMLVGDKCFREIDDRCWSPVRRIEDCDRTGVTVQVLSTVPVMFSYWARPEHAHDLSRILNDHIAEVCRTHPGRFVGLGTLPLQDPGLAVAELERCVRELDLAGVEIGTHVEPNEFMNRRACWNLDAPELFGIFEAAERLGAAVFVHPWDMVGRERMPKYWLPWLVGMPAETSLAICSMIFGGVFERLPRLRVCFAHGGGAFPFTIGRIEHGFNVRPDLCAVNNTVNPRAILARSAPDPRANDVGAGTSEPVTEPGCGPDGEALVPARFWVDSIVHDPDALRLLLRLFSDRRICLGSDYPFPLGEAEPGRLIETMEDIGASTRERLFVQSALGFLGLQRADGGESITGRGPIAETGAQ